MAVFMLSGSYTPEGLAGTMKAGLSARTDILSRAAESLGGRLLGMYWTTGVNDSVVIVEFPDATGPVALMTAVKSAGGGAVAISRLYDGAEFDAVMATTKDLDYSPPVQTRR